MTRSIILPPSTDPILYREYNAYYEHVGEFFGFPRPRKYKPSKEKRKSLKFNVFTRDNFTCQEVTCGKVFEAPKDFDGSQTIEGLTLGHVVPQSRGGKWTTGNIKAECYDCNHGRGDQLWEI